MLHSQGQEAIAILLPRQLSHKSTVPNSTYKKLVVQCLNEVLRFVSSFVVVDSFRLRNRQLLVAAFQDQKQVFYKNFMQQTGLALHMEFHG